MLATVVVSQGLSSTVAWKDCTEGTYETAIRGCTVILASAAEKSDERRATAHFRRGVAHDDLDQHAIRPPADSRARAIADFSAAILLAPDLAEAHVRRGLLYARRGNHDATIADLNNALRLDPNIGGFYNFRVYQSRGVAHFHRGEYDRSIADHTEEIRLTPHYADGCLSRAAAYFANGNADQAILDFTEAIRREPFRPEGYIGRGSIYLSRNDADRALAEFDEAIRRRPDLPGSAPAYRHRGLVLESKGNLTEALVAFEMALSLDPSDTEARKGSERTRAAPTRQQGK